MVHKKYIMIKGKKYGPYYYESYRENGKVKKRYVKNLNKKSKSKDKLKNTSSNKFLILHIILIAGILFLIIFTFQRFALEEEKSKPVILLSPDGPSTYTTAGLEITIWDDTDDGFDRYSFNAFNDLRYPYNFNFYSDFKDDIGNSIDDGSGSCGIRHNTGSGFPPAYDAMSYDSGNQRWFITTTFNKYGAHEFEVECVFTSTGASIQGTNFFTVSNTPPIFTVTGSILNGFEDEVVSHDYSPEVYDPDVNSVLVYTHSKIIGPLGQELNGDGSLYPWISISSRGITTITAANNGEAGVFDISADVVDETGDGESRTNQFNITAVNDPPQFIGLEEKKFNISSLFSYQINITDEENDIPFRYSISFLRCDTADWSTRNDIDCTLFTESDYILDYGMSDNVGRINISFIPLKNDVGVYTVNFTVWDLNNTIQPYNASKTALINFTVENINDAPYFTYVCDNEREAIEDSTFSCHINASDLDEVNNLTFLSDNEWFTFNNSNNNITATVGLLTMFNGYALVNFTPNDRAVGNWSVNITIVDTGGLTEKIRQNSTTFWFFIDNIDDSVIIHPLEQFTAYTSNPPYILYVNATDDDLLIPDKTVYPGKNIYPENLSFNSNESWLSISSFAVLPNSNLTIGRIQFNPAIVQIGLHHINISVTDSTGNIDSFIFNITIEGNNPPAWDISTPLTPTLNEDDEFYLNLSQYVSDADGDLISFSFLPEPGIDFNGFNLDSATGEINFTPTDLDVGQHIIQINVTDGKISTGRAISFTVENVNDNVSILLPLSGNSNVTFDSINSNNIESIYEDDYAEIYLLVKDDDLLVPSAQSSFYQEVHNVNLFLEGPNTSIFNFSFAEVLSPDVHRYTASFTPKKPDIGIYNVSINVSDISGSSFFLSLNMTLIEIDHAPVLTNLTDQNAAVNYSFFYDINASDVEDGSDREGNLTFSIEFLQDGKPDDFYLGNEDVFNSTSGIFNLTFIDSQAGRYHLNVTVSDLADPEILYAAQDFWIYVYDAPEILLPTQEAVFNLKEGNITNITFAANSSAGGNLSYELYFNGNLRQSINYFGNAINLVWIVAPSYADETYGGYGNMTLIVSVPGLEFINASRTWNANITHTNAPLRLIREINNQVGNAGDTIIINLSEYIMDEDAFDYHYNDTIELTINHLSTNSLITSELTNWELKFSYGGLAFEWFDIDAVEINRTGSILSSMKSNNFSVEFKEPKVIQVPVPSTGGSSGSSSSGQRPISLKLILPDPVSAFRGQVIILPITLENAGPFELRGIHLESLIANNGIISEDINMALSNNFFERLGIGEKKNVTLIVQLGTVEQGLYEITLNADVENPNYSDWGKIFISVNEGETIVERLVFVDELVASNPECIEIQELVDESREYLLQGNTQLAESKLNEALNACKEVISQQSLFTGKRLREKLEERAFIYLLLATIIAIVLGIIYYTYKTIMFKRIINESNNSSINTQSEKV